MIAGNDIMFSGLISEVKPAFLYFFSLQNCRHNFFSFVKKIKLIFWSESTHFPEHFASSWNKIGPVIRKLWHKLQTSWTRFFKVQLFGFFMVKINAIYKTYTRQFFWVLLGGETHCGGPVVMVWYYNHFPILIFFSLLRILKGSAVRKPKNQKMLA